MKRKAIANNDGNGNPGTKCSFSNILQVIKRPINMPRNVITIDAIE